MASAFHRDLHVDYAPEIYPRVSVTGANIGPHHKCLRHQLVIGYHCVSYLASSASNPSLGCANSPGSRCVLQRHIGSSCEKSTQCLDRTRQVQQSLACSTSGKVSDGNCLRFTLAEDVLGRAVATLHGVCDRSQSLLGRNFFPFFFFFFVCAHD